MPHSSRPVTRVEKTLFKLFPPVQRLVRGAIYATRELLVLGFVKHPRAMPLLERVARRHMTRHLTDPALVEKATPDYTIGCKRILPSNEWYPALARDNVELVADAVTEIR
jgi:cation diffusion facilitator CzcD-associated flavoprotein CzcO